MLRCQGESDRIARAESTALRNIAPSITVTKAAIPNTDEITAKMITERRVVNLTPMYRKELHLDRLLQD